MDFEKNLDRLEKIVAQMESGELSLEQSLNVFEEGVEISKSCHRQLNEAEQKVELLLGVAADGTVETKKFTEATAIKEPPNA